MQEDIFVARSSLPPLEEYIAEIAPLWESRQLTNMGEKHRQLEKELGEFFGAPHLTLFTNGHLALEAALQAMGLTGEVITTPFTFVSTTHAIIRSGLTPVYCDVKAYDYTIDPEKIEALITPRTTAIVPVHVYGNLCDVNAIAKIAKKHNLKVIYDAAHAFGAAYGGHSAAEYGDAAMFSFHATKVFHTIEGGCVVWRDAAVGEKLYQLKNFGIRGPEAIHSVGGNAKMTEFQAAMGLCNLRHVGEEIELRRRAFRRYTQNLSGIRGLRIPNVTEDIRPNYAYYPILITPEVFGAGRNDVYDRLNAAGIHPRKYFYPLANTLDCVKDRFDPGHTPVAADVAERVLTLPLYAGLTDEQVDRICAALLG